MLRRWRAANSRPYFRTIPPGSLPLVGDGALDVPFRMPAILIDKNPILLYTVVCKITPQSLDRKDDPYGDQPAF